MRISLVSQHLPELEGRANDRALYALGQGLSAEGHAVAVWSWRPEPPTAELPPWCHWEPLPTEARWRTRARALVKPRSDVVVAHWEPDGPVDVVVADGPLSFPAVAGLDRTAMVICYRVALDVRAARRWTPADIQDLRAERRELHRAGAVLAYSARVAAGTGAAVVPIGLVMPEHPLVPVEAPVAACLADWRWPPNRWALDVLLRAWPAVRSRLPGAELRLAGRGLDDVGPVAGVSLLGQVARSSDVLAEAAVVVFPCPPSSGPKVKVLETLALGRPLVTTEWGLEGMVVDAAAGTVVAEPEPELFAAAVATLLADPSTSRQMGLAGRTAVVAGHAPSTVARAHAAVLLSRWPELGSG